MHRFVPALICAGLILTPVAHGDDVPIRINHFRSVEVSDGAVRSVAFAPDGKMFATGGERLVQTFHWATGRRLNRFEGHTKPIRSVAFSPDGRMIASSSEDTTVRLWAAETAKPFNVLRVKAGFHDPINRVVFMPNGKTLVTCSPSPISQNQVQLVDVETGLWTYRARVPNPREPIDLAVSPDGKLIAIAEQPGIVALWEVLNFGIQTRFPTDRSGRQPNEFRMHHENEQAVSSVVFSSDSQRLLTSGRDNTVRLWEVKTGRELLKIAGTKTAKGFAGAVFARGGRIISVTQDETIQAWSASSGELLASIKGGEESVQGLEVSPDGHMLATFGSRGIVDLWDISPKSKNGTN